MPSITLAREWTDPHGTVHPVGAVLDVDDVTAALLQARGSLDALGESGGLVAGNARTGDPTDWTGYAAAVEP